MNRPPSSHSTPLLSIIVPAYNSESTLARSVDSVFSFETPETIEVIIVDDCSTDRTADVCTQLSLRYQGVRAYRNTENLGVARSRNKGITLARGRYIGFLDSDDYYTSDQFGRMALKFLREHEYDLILFPTHNMARNDNCYQELFDAGYPVPSSASLIQRINETEIDFDECNGCFIRREFLIKNDILFPRMRVGEDRVFMCSLTLRAKTFSHFNQIQYVHTARAGGLATTFSALNINAYSEGIGIVRRLHTHQRTDEKRVFLEHVLIKLFQSLCFYLLVFYRDIGTTFDGESNSNLKWITKRIFPYFVSTDTPSPISYKVLLNNFIDEIFERIPENLRNNDGVNYLYCLSEYSAAALGALTHKGMEIEAIIDDNRAGVTGYEHAGVRVQSLDDIDCTGQQPTPAGIEKRFLVCHPSENVYQNIKARLLDNGILERSIVWIRFFE